MEQLDFLYNGGETRRFHTHPVLREQRVDAHSWGVAGLCHYFMGNNIRPHLLLAAMYHDLAEHKVGDIPAPAKRGMSELMPDFHTRWGAMERMLLVQNSHQDPRWSFEWESHLTPNEQRILKLADAGEGALYCIRERMMGNKLIGICYSNFRKYIGEIIDHTFKQEDDFATYIDDMWEQANG